MPRSRTPLSKAEIAGATAKNPQRFRNRSRPKGTRPLGDPYKSMTDEQRVAWDELADNCPWLHSAHRPMVRMAAMWMAKLEKEPEFGINATNALSSLLSKLGATPADESKVNHASEEEDPDDEFFTTH
jgi:hypothetical protein